MPNIEKKYLLKQLKQLISSSSFEKIYKKGDEVLITELEHHLIIPWNYLRTEKGAVIKFAQVNENGDVEIEKLCYIK